MIVTEKFVGKTQFTGPKVRLVLLDNTLRIGRMANVSINTPYLKGDVDAVCLTDIIADLIIGNVTGTRPTENPELL